MIKVLIVLMVSFITLYGNNAIEINQDTSKNITPYIQIYIDDTQSKTFNDILKLENEFKIFNKSNFDFGYIVDKSVWVKFTLKNTTNKSIKKVIKYSDPLVTELFLYDNHKLVNNKQGVKYRPSSLRYIHSYFVVELKPYATTTFHTYLTTYYSAVHGKLIILNESDFDKEESKYFLLITIFFTIMGVLVTYNLFLYFFSKDKIYLAYSCTMFYLSFMHSFTAGYIFTFVEPYHRIYFENNIFNAFLLTGLLLVTTWFIKLFLQTKQYTRINNYLSFLFIMGVVFCLLLSIPSMVYLLEYYILFAYVAMFSFVLIGIYSIYMKNPLGIYFTLGYSLSIISLFLQTTHFLGIYPVLHKFPYIAEVLYTFEGFLFSFVLARRFKLLQTQNKALDKANNELKKLQQELNHRVKNNMQVILGLIKSQSLNVDDQTIQNKFMEIQDRIYAMDKIHDLLYKSTPDKFSPQIYFETLVDNIVSIFDDNYDVDYVVQCDEDFDMTYSNELALIINELIFNCFKYAFEDKQGLIKVNLKKNENFYFLEVVDDGIGMSCNARDNSMGLKLVNNLVEQKLQGKMDIISHNGTKIIISYIK